MEVKIMMRLTTGMVIALAASVAGAGEKPSLSPSTFTLGLVQKELRTGLSQTELVERLGSPSLLTRSSEGREAWVYDHVSSQIESESVGIGAGSLGTGGGTSLAGLFGISAGKRTSRSRASQRTLTVVIRFSEAGAVESFTWHESRF